MNFTKITSLILFVICSSLVQAQPGPMGGFSIQHLALPDGTLLMSNDSNLLVYTHPSPYNQQTMKIDYFRLMLGNSSERKDSTPFYISLDSQENHLYIEYKGQHMCAQLDVPGLVPFDHDYGSIDTLYFRPGNWLIHQYNRRGMTLEQLAEYRSRTHEPKTESYWLFEFDHHSRLSFPTVKSMPQGIRISSAIDLINYTENTEQIIQLANAIWTEATNTIEKQYASNLLWLAYERKGDYNQAFQWYLQFYEIWDNKFAQPGIVDFLIKIKHPEEANRFLSDMIVREPQSYNYVSRGDFYENVQLNYFAAVMDYQKALELEKYKELSFINPLASNDVAYLYFRIGRTFLKANQTAKGLEQIRKSMHSAHYYAHYEETLTLLDSLESTCGMSSDLYLAMALCEYRLAVLYPNTGRSPDNLFTDAELHFSMAEERGGNANLIAFFRADYYRILSQKEKALAYLKLAELDYSLKESCENLLPYITL
ncbi:MAG: hypothetical protein RLZZ77_332, partial [Bacteroidota bacterium]